MSAVLLDTHAWVWSLMDDAQLSAAARAAIVAADAVQVSPISFFEIGQKVRLGKWPQMESLARRLPELLQEQGGLVASMTPEICLRASLMDWAHRDPFDRMLLATAHVTGVPLISKDAVFAGRSEVQVIW